MTRSTLDTGVTRTLPDDTSQPCRSPYCECERGKCTHPGFHDARHIPREPDETPLNFRDEMDARQT